MENTYFRSDTKYDDNLTFKISAHFFNIKDENSTLWNYRDQDRLTLKVQYQF
jgi:hypothetical protein